MKSKLQIAIRKLNNTNNGSYEYNFQIRQQHSRMISFQDKQTRYRMMCASSPQVSPSTLYLRGTSKLHDNDWVIGSSGDLANVIDILIKYAYFNDYQLDFNFDTKNNEEVVIHMYDNDQQINRSHSLISIYNSIEKLKPSSVEYFKRIVTCDKCNKESLDASYLPNIGMICKPCCKHLEKCQICHSLVLKCESKKNSLNVEYKVCKKCSKEFTCNFCNCKELTIFAKIGLIITKDGRNLNKSICSKCFGNSHECSSCGCGYSKNYTKCPCRMPSDFRRMIRAHNADVTEILQMDIDCELGLEIEVGVECANRPQYEEVFNHTEKILGNDAITVFDRSIDEVDTERHIANTYRGFEIVTRPMNYKNMIKFIDNLTEKRHPNLRSWDVKTTGIHIHVARNKCYIDNKTKQLYQKPFITKIEIGKLLVFINNPFNIDFVTHVARRNNSRYARLTTKRIVDYRDSRRECHYEAVNTNKPNTIEFRIFRGTLNKDTIYSYIQFVFASIEFVRKTSAKNLTFTKFIKWLDKTDKSSYRQLKERISKFGEKGQLEIGGEV